MNVMSEIQKIVPQDVIDEIIQLREDESQLSWRYGKLANRVYHYIIANELDATRLEACGFVSMMIDNHRAPNTILRYAMVQEFFANKKSREKYDFLPFSHFELAMQFGKDWRKVLDKSSSLMAGNFGRPPSRAQLEQAMRPEQIKALKPTYTLETRINFADELTEDKDDLSELNSLLARLQNWLTRNTPKHPNIAGLLAQALLILQNAMEKVHETETDPEFA